MFTTDALMIMNLKIMTCFCNILQFIGILRITFNFKNYIVSQNCSCVITVNHWMMLVWELQQFSFLFWNISKLKLDFICKSAYCMSFMSRFVIELLHVVSRLQRVLVCVNSCGMYRVTWCEHKMPWWTLLLGQVFLPHPFGGTGHFLVLPCANAKEGSNI